jgi:hypothetical protein
MTYVDALNYVLNMDTLDNDNDEVR